MTFKKKIGFCSIISVVLGVMCQDVFAVGRSYEFNAGSPQNGQWNLSLHGNGDHYFLPFFDGPDVSSNFIEANSLITGQFSYNTNTPADTPRNEKYAFYYGDTSFSVDLTSESGVNGRFNLVGPYATVQNHSVNSQHFGVRGFRGTIPPITLNEGCEVECGGGSFFSGVDLPIDEMRQDHPDIIQQC